MPGWKSRCTVRTASLNTATAASAAASPAAAGWLSANWSYWQVGSRTVWTPVQNLDLSVEVMYQNQDTAFPVPAARLGDNDWWSGMFRAQRNFYP